MAFKRHPGKSGPDSTFYQFRPILPPRDRFWADPCPIERDGRHFVFFEEFMYATVQGHISVMEIMPDGSYSPATTVLKKPYHLAYPYMFEWKGALFMVPDSSRDRSLQLFRCTKFPDEWTLEALLMKDVSAADATLHEIDGRWWMFTTIADPAVLNYDELHLFYADSPIGPWQPHPLNPVKSDVRSARPAGRLFEKAGALYRPAQDCSVRYGYGIRINRIHRLDVREYEETEAGTILPNWDPNLIATHTLNSCPGLTVIDGKRKVRKF
jgi:hypothetical protein